MGRGIATPQPSLVVHPSFCGVERLWENRNLTINGQTVAPDLFFVASDINWDAMTWQDRVTGTILSEAGAGASPTQDYAPWGRDGAAKFNANHFQAPSVALGTIETEDFILEVVAQMRSTASQETILSTFANTPGYQVYIGGGGGITPSLYIKDATAAVAIVSAGAVAAGAWFHLIGFFDRSGSGQWYLMGVISGGAAVISGVAASLVSTKEFAVGGRADDVLPYTANIAYCAMWKKAAWLDTHLQADLAKHRTELLFGSVADYATNNRPVSW